MNIILERVKSMFGTLREKTFMRFCELIVENPGTIIETGCYRGIPADGQSTIALAMIARHVRVRFHSFDTSQHHIDLAKELLSKPEFGGLEFHVEFHCIDSVTALSLFTEQVSYAYLDSFDHDEKNPTPCQRHQLAEIGAIYGKLRPDKCAVLMDDNVSSTGGKPFLASKFLVDRGWKSEIVDYQMLFMR